MDAEQGEMEYQRTLDYWREWSAKCRYDGPYAAQVRRSALVLKLLMFQPSGGFVAAPTTSLPAEIGGVRNWDYRYTWLRDSGMTLDVLQQLGYHEESLQFIDWLHGIAPSGPTDLKIMYAIDGGAVPSEQHLNSLTGYRNSRPVRVGNDAAKQTQEDMYGHILDAITLSFERLPRDVKPAQWQLLRLLANGAATQWQHPGQGPWEMRGPPRHFVYSKLFCWVGLDRIIRFAEKHHLEGEIDTWKQQRDAIRAAILSRGFNTSLQSFTQTFDGNDVDASVLALPIVGFIDPNDERVKSTLRRTRQELASDGLLYRYRTNDGLPGSDATFSLCSFWLVSALALSGSKDEARSHFEHICGFANDVGLFAEQIDANNGALLGNFPQGFTHLGLIRAALHLQKAASV